MKLLLDQGLPRSTGGLLAEHQIVTQHVGDLGLSMAGDDEILEAARERGAIVVTLDADFHAILAAAQATTPSVIRVRIEGLKGDDLAALFVRVLKVAEAELSAGAAVSVTVGGVRVRILPLP